MSKSRVVLLIVLVALGAFLSARIRNGIFDQRVTQILGESARSTQQAQNTFDSSTAGTESDVQELLNDMARALQSGGSGDREVFLLPSPGNHAPIVLNTVVSASDLVPLISPELRAATVAGKGQRWQSVAEPVRRYDLLGVDCLCSGP